MKFIRIFALSLGFSLAAHAADMKFGVVDLSKAFADFYKTKEANVMLQENQAKAKEELNERYAALKKIADEIEKLRKEGTDPVLSDAIRSKKRSEFESKAQEMRSLDQQIGEFRQRREAQLQSEGMQQRKGLYDEILKVVGDKAKADGYDFVFDKSGLSAYGLPILIHVKEGAATDFTAEVIVELNKNAPAATETKDSKAK